MPGAPDGRLHAGLRPGRRPGAARRRPGYAERRRPRPDLVHRQRRRLRRRRSSTMLEENLGVTIDYATMDFATYQDAAGDRPAADLEHLVGRRLSGPQRLPRRPAGHRVDRQPGRLVVARRSTPRSPTPPRRPTRRPPPPPMPGRMGIVRDQAPVVPVSYGTSFSLVRDGLLGASQNGHRHPAPRRPRLGGRPMTRPPASRAADRALVARACRRQPAARRTGRRPLGGRRHRSARPTRRRSTTSRSPSRCRRHARPCRSSASSSGCASRTRSGRSSSTCRCRRAPGTDTLEYVLDLDRRRPHRAQHDDRRHLGGVHGSRAASRSLSRDA